MQTDLIDAVAITAELTGTQLTEGAARVMVQDLSAHPVDQVLIALQRCRRELKGRLTIADVLQRLDDGRPGVEQAWSMIPQDEDSSVVWTDEMALAYGAASPLLQGGDSVAARMAFKECYEKELQKARDEGRAVKWRVSFGHDPSLREDAVIQAVEKKQITSERAVALLPHSDRVLIAVDPNQKLLVSDEGQKEIKDD